MPKKPLPPQPKNKKGSKPLKGMSLKDMIKLATSNLELLEKDPDKFDKKRAELEKLIKPIAGMELEPLELPELDQDGGYTNKGPSKKDKAKKTLSAVHKPKIG